MKKFSTILREAKVKAVVTKVLDVAKLCNNFVPLSSKNWNNDYNTTELAKIYANGGYTFNTDGNTFFISAEDASKVEGLTKFFNDHSSKPYGVYPFKIGSRTYKMSTVNRPITTVNTKAHIITVEGESVDKIVKNSAYKSVKKIIENGLIINSMKVDLGAGSVLAMFGSSSNGEKQGFYVKQWSDGIQVILKSSSDIIKGRDVVIFGQQHASRNEKFKYYKAGDLEYRQMTYNEVAPAKAYTRSNIVYRKEGVYVAK